MSFPPKITDLPADYSVDRGGLTPVAIVAHGTGGTDSRSTLQHGDGRGVSIHRLIPKSGDIYRMVPDERGANHAGAPTAVLRLPGHVYYAGMINHATLGFELENLQNGEPYPETQLLAMGWQINDWRRRWGHLPIVRHETIDPTRRRDPVGLSVAEIERWATIAEARMDVWSMWGSRYPLPPEQRAWGIPQLWKDNASWLGEARSDELYLADGNMSLRVFQGGLIYYEKAGGRCTLGPFVTRLS